MKDAGINEDTWIKSANCPVEWRKLVGETGMANTVQAWHAKRDIARRKRKESESARKSEKKGTDKRMSEEFSDIDSDIENEVGDPNASLEEECVQSSAARSAVERAQRNYQDNHERIQALIEGRNKVELKEDYTHMQDDIKEGRISVRNKRREFSGKETSEKEPRFSAKRVMEEKKKACTDGTSVAAKVAEKVWALHGRSKGQVTVRNVHDRWFATEEDAGEILGREASVFVGRAMSKHYNFTESIKAAIRNKKNAGIAGFSYHWEWVSPSSVKIEVGGVAV
jgi:hypothetical protein